LLSRSRLTWQVDVLLLHFEEMQDCGDDFLVLDYSKVLEFEEGSEVLRPFANALLEFSQLPLRYLILSQLFVLDLVILHPGFN
jgi:hypothetical protein